MPDPFMNLHFHVSNKTQEEFDALTSKPKPMRGAARGITGGTLRTNFDNDEAAARFYLSRVLERDERPAVRGLAVTERPEVVPDMRLQVAQTSPLTKTRLLRFLQTHSSIPVFGSQVVVELDKKRHLVGINGKLATLEKLDAVPSISQKQALDSIAEKAGVEPEELRLQAPENPETIFFHDEKTAKWHLAYFFQNIPAATKRAEDAPKPPEEIAKKLRGHGLGPSPRDRFMRLNYLVDAHDGKILLYYSAMPTISVCRGIDELDTKQKFYGLKVGNDFEMHDELRKIKTYNLAFQDVGSALPGNPVRSNAADFSNANKAAVSAHVNATRVYDFYKSVLMRDGVDDKGMELASVVNCTYSAEEAAPQWHNAVWWDRRMWYGQVLDEKDKKSLQSFSRYLDVIAHELTHGVTENTANLVYLNESGALNESFSDIFGIIISNWYNKGANSDTPTWTWEIGAGLGENGLPLRDMSNPKRTEDPDHMADYKKWPATQDGDWGGVHVNSNIHNKAAYNVLTAVDGQGKTVFPAQEIAVMYYLCLSRLSNMATFGDALRTLVDVASTFYAGDEDGDRAKKIQYIKDAYRRVGIDYLP